MRGVGGILVGAIVAALLAAGCGGGGNGGGGSSGGGTKAAEPVTLTVGYIPITDCAPLFIGIKKGFFKKQKLTIKPQPAAGGAAIVPAVVSGSNQIGFSNTVSMLQAVDKGLPLKAVGMGVQTGKDRAHDYSALVAKGNSGITSPKDLEGKTVSVNTLNNIAEVTVRNDLDQHGVDTSKVKFTEIDFPDAPAALKAGRVAATFVVEPFWSVEKAQGGRTLMQPFVDTAPGMAVSEWVTTDEYLNEHKDVIDRFHTAITQANLYAQQHPDYVRKVLLDYTKIPPKAAKSVRLATWSAQTNLDSVEVLNRLSVKYGLYKKPVELKGLFPYVK